MTSGTISYVLPNSFVVVFQTCSGSLRGEVVRRILCILNSWLGLSESNHSLIPARDYHRRLETHGACRRSRRVIGTPPREIRLMVCSGRLTDSSNRETALLTATVHLTLNSQEGLLGARALSLPPPTPLLSSPFLYTTNGLKLAQLKNVGSS